MRPPRIRNFSKIDQQVLCRTREFVYSGRLFSGTFPSWPRGPRPLPSCSFPTPNVAPRLFHPIPSEHLSIVCPDRVFTPDRVNTRSSWKKGRNPIRSRFRSRKRSRNSTRPRASLNPNDPLNLQDLIMETERRRVEGLSPLRGDSRLNTPALSVAGDMEGNSPVVQPLPSVSNARPSPDTQMLKRFSDRQSPLSRARSRFFPRGMTRRQYGRSLPITGNYRNYYFRRDPNDRLSYLMPEWFTGKDVADYGCHNGTLTFGILERFPEVRRIDAIDCDAELIANARSMQRERLRWDTGSGMRYDKINFQIGNWIDGSTPTEDPEYDTIMAFSVTKWIHLNHGDSGLMRFFRRAFNLLKPGGHLLLEPQPKSSYRRTRFTARQRATFQTLKIDPVKLEPLLVELGFSYFDTIKLPRPNEPFRRKIILCSKSYGATPASIRNENRSEFQLWNQSPSPQSLAGREPPPVCYYPQTPLYPSGTPANFGDSPASGVQLAYVVPSTVTLNTSRPPANSPDAGNADSASDAPCEPDSTSVS